MADFCRQCIRDVLGVVPNFGQADLEGLTRPEDWAEGKAVEVICEGCGPTQVDPTGRCVSDVCTINHDPLLKGQK
jgi:hypothetical protein